MLNRYFVLMTKEKNVILDSSVWISSFIKEDVFYYESLREVNRLLRKRVNVLVPTIVIYEIVNVMLRKKYSQKEVLELVKFILSECTIIDLDREVILPLMMKLAQMANLRTQDLTILAYCASLNLDGFYTNDIKLRRAYNKLRI